MQADIAAGAAVRQMCPAVVPDGRRNVDAHPVSGKPATEQPRAKGVHSWYETALVNHFRVGKIAKVVDGESGRGTSSRKSSPT